jgi:hypothetical protein
MLSFGYSHGHVHKLFLNNIDSTYRSAYKDLCVSGAASSLV